MLKFQGVLKEADTFLRPQNVIIKTPILPISSGVLYQVHSTELDLGPLATGLVSHITHDYAHESGIGGVVSPVYGMEAILEDVRQEAEKILSLINTYARTLAEMSELCFQHMIHCFPGDKQLYRGGLFRIVISAKSAVLQIVFHVGSNIYAVGYEAPLKQATEIGLWRLGPFKQLPPNIEIPLAEASGYVPATFENCNALLREKPINSKKPNMCRFRTHDILSSTEEFIGALMHI